MPSCDGINTILNKNNDFAGQSKLLITSIRRSLCNSIYLEFCSQVEKLLSLGIEISHIDSHEQIHTIPSIFPILKHLQRTYNIRKVRISRNIYLPNYRVSMILLLKKKIYNFMLRNYYASKTTYGFGGLMAFYKNAERNNLNHRTIEIMVHPRSEKFKEENVILKPSWYREIPINSKLINLGALQMKHQ